MKSSKSVADEISDLTQKLKEAREQLEIHFENISNACMIYLFWKNEADTLAETLHHKFLFKAKNKKSQRCQKKSRKSM